MRRPLGTRPFHWFAWRHGRRTDRGFVRDCPPSAFYLRRNCNKVRVARD